MSSVPQTTVRPELHVHAEGNLNTEVSTVRSGESCWRICYCARDRTDPRVSREEPKALTILAGLVEFECELVPARISAGRYLDEPCQISLRNSTSQRMIGDWSWKFEGGRHAN